VAVGAYIYYSRALRLKGSPQASIAAGGVGAPLVPMKWQMVSRPDEGFRLEMPADPRDAQVPAFNDTGGSEPVKMLFSSPDGGDTTFAITWSDNPPVARANHGQPEQTLDQARDGMLARTQTTLVNETREMAGGYPACDIRAKNDGGGLLYARLIYMDDRLYTLMALFPSAGARREQDVLHFYNSFTPTGTGTGLPRAGPKG